jgi:hypothetical protein
MALITATQVTIYSNISASAATIASSGLIPVVQERVNWITNNYYTTDLYVRGAVTFDAAAATITMSGTTWEGNGFAAGDEIYVYHSYRNDGYHTVSSISTSILTITSATSVVAELSGRSVLISVVQWPRDLLTTAARMIAYDYDTRPERAPGVQSVRLGPWGETYKGEASGEFGYPEDILAPLYSHRIVRLM